MNVRARAQEARHAVPVLNANVEWFIQTIQIECLNHFLVFGEKHFNYLAREFVRSYHQCRPRQGIENRVIDSADDEEPPSVLSLTEVQCETRLGGLLRHDYRAA